MDIDAIPGGYWVVGLTVFLGVRDWDWDWDLFCFSSFFVFLSYLLLTCVYFVIISLFYFVCFSFRSDQMHYYMA